MEAHPAERPLERRAQRRPERDRRAELRGAGGHVASRPVLVVPPLGVLTPVAAATLAIVALLLSTHLGTPWPAALLPAAGLLVGLRPLPGAVAGACLGLLLGAAVVGLLLTGAVVAAAAVAAACLSGLACALVWRRGRLEAAEALAAAHDRADAVAVVDPLTGCLNANGLDLLARQVIGAVRRQGGALHAGVVEVPGLDRLTSHLGPQAADAVLVAVADALRASTRGADVVCRFDSVTFVVLGPGTGTTPGELERRLRSRLLAGPPVPRALWPCTVTIGCAMLEPWDAGGVDELLARASEDLSLRRALRAPSAVEPELPEVP